MFPIGYASRRHLLSQLKITQQLAPVRQAVEAQPVQQFERRQFDVIEFCAAHGKGIVRRAPDAAAKTLHVGDCRREFARSDRDKWR